MADGLDGQSFTQRTRYDITLTLSDPLANHPLNPDGFNSTGYELSLIAKQNKSHADSDAKNISIGNSRFTILTDTTASFSLLPSDTSSTAISGKKEYSYEVRMTQTADPDTNDFPIMSGSFTIVQSTKGG